MLKIKPRFQQILEMLKTVPQSSPASCKKFTFKDKNSTLKTDKPPFGQFPSAFNCKCKLFPLQFLINKVTGVGVEVWGACWPKTSTNDFPQMLSSKRPHIPLQYKE
jgi:hypothetical protein